MRALGSEYLRTCLDIRFRIMEMDRPILFKTQAVLFEVQTILKHSNQQSVDTYPVKLRYKEDPFNFKYCLRSEFWRSTLKLCQNLFIHFQWSLVQVISYEIDALFHKWNSNVTTDLDIEGFHLYLFLFNFLGFQSSRFNYGSSS